MREIALATLIAGILFPATLNAQPDGGLPDGMASGEPRAMQMDDHPTGYSSDPNGNMGDEGRTGRDAGAADASPSGAEGTSGKTDDGKASKWGVHQSQPQRPGAVPSPYGQPFGPNVAPGQ